MLLSRAMARIAIVGGGLAGLCAAYTLSRARHSVLVLEGAPRLGGQIHTARSDGFVAELGAEGYVARSDALPKLARELGIEAELVGQVEQRSLGYRSGQLQELAPGESASFLGFQVAKSDLGEGIRTLRTGMAQLIEALEQKLASTVEMRLGLSVQQIERRAKGYTLRASDGSEPDRRQARDRHERTRRSAALGRADRAGGPGPDARDGELERQCFSGF